MGTRREDLAVINGYGEAMREFSGTMKTCVSLGASALVFPITLLKALNIDKTLPVNGFLYIAWFCLGLSIALGLVYQIDAARRIARSYGLRVSSFGDILPIGVFFNSAILLLLLGLGLLAIAMVMGNGCTGSCLDRHIAAWQSTGSPL